MTAHWLVEPAAVVLGTVAPEQRELARNLMAGDQDFRAEVERLRRLADTLGELPVGAWTPEAAELPALDLDRLTQGREVPPRPAFTPSEPAVARPRRRRRLVLRPVLAAVAAAGLLGAGVGVGLLAGSGDDTTPAPRSAPVRQTAQTDPWVLASLRPLPGSGRAAATGRVAVTLHPGGRARLDVAGLAPTRDGSFYEAWLMTDDRHLVALGTFKVGPRGRARMDVPFGADPRAYRYVDVSLQREDGGPGHSGRSVLRTDELG